MDVRFLIDFSVKIYSNRFCGICIIVAFLGFALSMHQFERAMFIVLLEYCNHANLMPLSMGTTGYVPQNHLAFILKYIRVYIYRTRKRKRA